MTEKNPFESQWFLGNNLNLNYPDEKEGFKKLFELINHYQETSQVNSQTMVALKLAGLLQEALFRLYQTKYELRVTQHEASGMTRSDAQAVVDAEDQS